MLARTTPLSITNLMLADSGWISNPGGALVTSPRTILRIDIGILKKRPVESETPKRRARASKVIPATRIFFRILYHKRASVQ